MPAWLAVLATLGLGVAVGAVNGIVVTALKVNSFIATLAMASIVEAVIYGVTDGRQIVGSVSPTFLRFGQSQPFGVPAPIFYMAGIAFVAWVVYAAYLHSRATAGWRGGKAAWINILGFSATVFNLFFVNLVTAGLHSYANG